ncbi:MAG TPA: hypothetical protein VFZ65_05110 [Planctomycetota bacterium]|nr:hypothetical protein [Planctomycetota bacterium]
MRCPDLGLLSLALLGACANPRYFAPRENVNGSGPGGYPAAVYPIADGAAMGEVRVWSAGTRAIEVEENGEPREIVELHAGFEVENTGAEALALDVAAVTCEDLQIGALRIESLSPVSTVGQARAEPGKTVRLEAFFRPGPAERPRDVASFSLRFRVTAGDRPVLVQVTPFEPYAPAYYWHDDWAWGYPGCWGSPYWSVGFGWHHHWH